MKVGIEYECDGCGASWLLDLGQPPRAFCPDCREIWHRVGHTCNGLVLKIVRT